MTRNYAKKKIPEEKKNLAKPEKIIHPPPDDPLRRHGSHTLDLEQDEEERKKIAELRRTAFEQARTMPTSEEE